MWVVVELLCHTCWWTCASSSNSTCNGSCSDSSSSTSSQHDAASVTIATSAAAILCGLLWMKHYHHSSSIGSNKSSSSPGSDCGTSRALASHGSSTMSTDGDLIANEHKRQQQRKLDFLQRRADSYGYAKEPCGFIDTWRSRELPGLIAPIPLVAKRATVQNQPFEAIGNTEKDDEQEVYLDYAGAALPTLSLLQAILERNTLHILANPHSSGGPAAARTLQLVEQAKQRILTHFGAHPTSPIMTAPHHPGYDVVFTSGATDALRLVAERFPWSPGSSSRTTMAEACSECQSAFNRPSSSSLSLLVYPHNAHTSVVGMRGVALRQGASFLCKPLDAILKDIATATQAGKSVDAIWKRQVPIGDGTTATGTNSCQRCMPASVTHNLLVLPMECNFGGDRPNVELAIRQLRQSSSSWYTMLDIAKAAATSPVNLCQLDPDFACVSFYKLFGEPTGLGCLLVKRTSRHILEQQPPPQLDQNQFQRGYFGGGSVDAVLAGTDFVIPRSDSSLLSGGTSHYRGIVALLAGFDELDKRYGSMQAIERHAQCLAQELVRRLSLLVHGNGRPVVSLYGAWNAVKDDAFIVAGPTVALNIIRADGAFVGYNEVSKLAALHRPAIQLRTGCFCNPGACQAALNLTDEQVIANYRDHGHACGDDVDLVNGRPTGAVRVSFGKDSSWEDLDVFVSFIEEMFVSTPDEFTVSETSAIHNDALPCPLVLDELYVFPIKSCSAQRVTRWPMDSTSGRLRYDREFAIVDSSGMAMRLQTFPKMSLLRPVINLDDGTLTLHAPGQVDLVLSLDHSENETSIDSSLIKVCGNKCSGMIVGDGRVSEWLSRFLDTRCWLARISAADCSDRKSEPERASVSPPYAKRRDPQLAFVNDHPLLVVSKHAVDTLNEVLASRNSKLVSARQFRPNLVVRCLDDSVTTSQQSTQEQWHHLRLVDQDVALEYAGRCARCAMVDFDPVNGEKVPILRALVGYRRSQGQITFGVYYKGTSKGTKATPNWIWLREGDFLSGEQYTEPEGGLNDR